MAKEINSLESHIFINEEIKIIELSRNKNKIIINEKYYDRAVITTSPNVNSKILKNISYKNQTQTKIL